MKARFCAFPIISLAVCALLASCNSDGRPAPNKALLIGKWELYKAMRNQKPTETLSGTYFTFDDAGQMVTNLPVGPEAPCPYDVDGAQIKQKCGKPLVYNIVELSDSLLTLTIELRGMPFELFMRRGVPGAPAEAPADSLVRDTTVR